MAEDREATEKIFTDYFDSDPAGVACLSSEESELSSTFSDIKDKVNNESNPASVSAVDTKLVRGEPEDAVLKTEPESPPIASTVVDSALPVSQMPQTSPSMPLVTVKQQYQLQQNIPTNHPQYMYPLAPPPHALFAQAAPPMPYAMAPRFLHPMVVETSTGHLHLQPFISQDGQIGITPVTPCHPQMQAIPPVPVDMHWSRPCYPNASANGITGFEAMQMAPQQAMYLPPKDMLQQYAPQYVGGAQHTAATSQTATAFQNSNTISKSHNQQSCAQSRDDNHAKTCSQDCSNLPSQSDQLSKTAKDSHKTNTLQKACALSNIPMVSASKSDQAAFPTAASLFLKSPDSGFGEGQVEPVLTECEVSGSSPSSPTTSSQRMKRRRSSMCSHSRQSKATNNEAAISFRKRENDATGYEIFMDVATSCSAKLDEDRMTYLNKGQLYTLVIRNTLPLSHRSTFVKSVMTLRFRDESNRETVSKNWYYWSTRQEDSNPKALELGLKDAEGIVENSLTYNGINSLTFSWLPQECVKVQFAVHCLSTDFTSQKGVKGLPLHIQVDTYDDINASNNLPVHRAYAQIKIFCDKGAERKARDEEKRKDKSVKSTENPGAKQSAEQYHSVMENTPFYSLSDLFTDVFIYKPASLTTDTFDLPFRELMASSDSLLLGDNIVPSIMDNDTLFPPGQKKMKLNETDKVFIYVREVDDSAFTAILLETPTVLGLCTAIQEKFPFVSHIKTLLKRTNKRMLVRMDDKLIKHLLHESSYVIEFKKLADNYEVIFTETDE
ncbi:grainyhead-like protein 2 homolog [Watersipora subatra]|uniref:grainyhead-like protein 2 homolog n=1 Tax=Watersipora subatra TaxID=2589382 RepID=UPI00355B3AA6